MRKERLAAAATVAAHLIEAERAMDKALETVALLTAAMSASRVAANLSAVTGYSAFSRVTSATQLLGQARSELALSHIDLNDVKTEIGLRTLNYGGGMGCPERGADAIPNVIHLHAA